MRICDTPGCGGKHRAKGLCSRCYNRAMTTAGYVWERKSTPPECMFDGCDKPRYNAEYGLCAGHNQQRKRGQELRPLLTRTPAAVPRRRPRKANPLPKTWEQNAPKPRPVKAQQSALMRTVVFVPPTQPATLAAVLAGLRDRGCEDLAEVLGVAPDQIRAEAARWAWWEGTAA